MRTLLLIMALAACAPGAPAHVSVLVEDPMLIIIAGQSNAVGGADIDDITVETGYELAYPAVHLDWQMALAQAVPIDWIFYSGPLAPRDAGAGGLRLGVELSLGRTLGAIAAIGKFAVSGTSLANRWHPSATYPAGDPLGNLYTQFIDYIQALELELGMQTTAIVWVQGNADGALLATAEAYQANLETFLDQIRTDLGRKVVFAFDELPTIDAPFASTVRAEQAAFALANQRNRVVMIETSDLGMRDGDHYTADATVELGKRFGYALVPFIAGGYIMAGTTFEDIREKQLELLRTLVPTEVPDQRFRAWEANEADFPSWANASGGPFRTVEIEHRFDFPDEKYLDTETANVVHTETVLVCYPNVRQVAGRHIDYIIDRDIIDIQKAIGQRAYGSYETLGEGQHVAQLVGAEVQRLPAARLLILTLQLDYDRDIP